MDVRHDPQVLFDATNELFARGTELQRTAQLIARLRPFSTLDVNEREPVQRFGGEHAIGASACDLVAPLAERDRLVVLVSPPPNYAQATQRFGEHGAVARRLGDVNGRLVTLDRFDDTSRALVLARFAQKDDRAPGPSKPRRRVRRKWTNADRHSVDQSASMYREKWSTRAFAVRVNTLTTVGSTSRISRLSFTYTTFNRSGLRRLHSA